MGARISIENLPYKFMIPVVRCYLSGTCRAHGSNGPHPTSRIPHLPSCPRIRLAPFSFFDCVCIRLPCRTSSVFVTLQGTHTRVCPLVPFSHNSLFPIFLRSNLLGLFHKISLVSNKTANFYRFLGI